MDDRDKTTHQFPGNTGDWYLEALGVDPQPAPPTHTESSETTFIIEGEPTSTSIPAPIEAPTRAPGPSPKGEERDEAAAASAPVVEEHVEPRRFFRWWMVVASALIVAAVVATALWLPTTSEAEAREEAADYRTALEDMRGTLPGAQQTLATATEPASSPIDLLPLSAQLSRLQAAAREVVARASRELPDTLPFAPRGPVEDLIPTRQRMTELGDRGRDIVERISATITYRTTLEGILDFLSLPVRADPQQIEVLAGALSDTLAASSTVVTDLPMDPAFDEHRELAAAAVASFAEWREDYLEALRTESPSDASALIDELTDLRSELFRALVPALATVRSQVDAAIITLNEDVTEAILAIPR